MLAPVTTFAQAATSSVSGLVVDRRNALPISAASISLVHAGAVTASTTTDPSGRYVLTNVAPGLYTLVVRAAGYDVSESDEVALAAGTASTINVSLILSPTNGAGPAVIGRTSTTTNALTNATAISQVVSVENLARTGQIRLSDQLGTIPGVNFSTSSSVGDDSSINLRGFGSDESASLLDGHPIGPLGVGSGGFNFSLGPSYGLSHIDVTFGSGAQGLYGSDTIGGAVNYVTLSPTATPQFSFQQQVGGFGIRSTGVTATGTVGRFGYAAAAGRFGEYGDFYPGQMTQSARPNNVVPPSADANGNPVPGTGSANPNGLCSGFYANDVSSCNAAVNTYAVSQNTQQSVLLGKLAYAISPTTSVLATVYDAAQWSDSTGNGDNDDVPYSTRLAQVLQGAPNCTTASGAPGYTVTTNPQPTSAATGTSCYTAAQFAAASYGPDGGGAGRQRSTRLSDYQLRFETKIGTHTITASAFHDFYEFWKDSSLAGGIGFDGSDLGSPTYADTYDTQGFLLDDEFSTGRHDIGFGYSAWHQLQQGTQDDISGITPRFGTGYFGEYSFFARDAYQMSDAASLFVNAWLKHSSVTERTTFDPRATLQLRPSTRDVVQFTYGRSDGAPSPQLKLIGAAVASDPGSSLTSVNCNGLNDVTSAGNPNLRSESANDFEVGYGHRFSRDSNVQVNAFVTTVTDQLFGASQPLLQYGLNNVAFAPGALTTYIDRLNSQCGLNLNNQTVLQYLSVSTTYNAAQALARGIELSGRARVSRYAYVDYDYAVESSVKTGISDAILASNPTVVNGAQIVGIPLHQATLSYDYTIAPWEFRIDNYYVGTNNGLNRPQYWHSNAFLSRSFDNGRALLTLGGTNIFNSAVQVYGFIGYGTAAMTNAVAGQAPIASEEFGLAPAQLTLTLRYKI